MLRSVAEWKEHEVVGDELPGKRKYAHLVYKSFRGTLADFLLVFQRACIRMKPHKFYHHRGNERKLLSRLSKNTALTEGVVAIYADYSQNLKKMSTTSGIAIQYRDMPDFSLLNVSCFIRLQEQIIRFDYHCISDDPKHVTCLWRSSLRQVIDHILALHPEVTHFEVTTDTSKREGRVQEDTRYYC